MRVFLVVMLVVLLSASTYVTPQLLKAKNIQLPTWNVRDLPLQFDEWQGVAAELDPEVTGRMGADAWADRVYRDDQNRIVSLHAALFRDLDAGVFHSPVNCYRMAGWREVSQTETELAIPGKPSIPVRLDTWELKGERILVMYWYQLDQHIFFDRWGLLRARWEMRGEQSWPPLIKVLLQTSAADPEDAKRRIRFIAARAYEWINQPSHQASSVAPED
jgi:EpsI family protein